MTFGERVKTLRQEAGWTQEELGEKIHVSARVIGYYDCLLYTSPTAHSSHIRDDIAHRSQRCSGPYTARSAALVTPVIPFSFFWYRSIRKTELLLAAYDHLQCVNLKSTSLLSFCAVFAHAFRYAVPILRRTCG